MFETDDWKSLRTLGTIGLVAGVGRDELVKLVAKELVDNALDAGGDCEVDLLWCEGAVKEEGESEAEHENGFYVLDHGPGIPGTDEEIAGLFSISRPRRTSKLRLPSRGALGNGLRVVAGAVLASGGSLVVSTMHRTLRLIPRESGGTDFEDMGAYKPRGTRIEVRFGPDLLVGWADLDWANEAISMACSDANSYAGGTSPWWYDSDSFFELVDSATDQTVADVVGAFDGLSGAKGLKLAKPFGKGRPAKSLDRREADELLGLMRAHSKANFNPERLKYVGKIDALPPCYAKAHGDFPRLAVKGEHHATIPYTIEAWAEVAEEPECVVCVNRTPITAGVRSWQHEGDQVVYCGDEVSFRFKGKRKPLKLWLNVTTPYMPLRTIGKAPDLAVLRSPIKELFAKVARQVKSGSVAGGTEGQKQAILDSLDAAVDKASGSGTNRYSERQLYYATRILIGNLEGMKVPSFNYFKRVIRDHEASLGHDLENIYRDSRGVFYEPHSDGDIPLGSLNVEKYRRPDWRFNKVLYCEKEGFFPLLKDAKWPERNDCALMTSKGFSTRATQDLLILLGETAEEVQFFCVHDADAFGTMIYQTLQESGRGEMRPVIDLGLNPWDAREIGLESESFERKKNKSGKFKVVPVAKYVTSAYWRGWLQSNRYELNAMTSPQFLAWLDRNFAEFAGKLVPPPDVAGRHLEEQTEAMVRSKIISEVLAEADIDGRVSAAMEGLAGVIREKTEDIADAVSHALEADPTEPWTEPVERIAGSIADWTAPVKRIAGEIVPGAP